VTARTDAGHHRLAIRGDADHVVGSISVEVVDVQRARTDPGAAREDER
jgi:hypothetical protein